MLVLGRKAGETLTIGDDVTLVVLNFEGTKRTRIGINAPRRTRVLRGEVPVTKPADDPEKEGNGTLVLNRSVGETVEIGEEITITIVAIQHDGLVRIGIEAPRHIQVVRDNAKVRTQKEEVGADDN